jgi:hypothetical protein
MKKIIICFIILVSVSTAAFPQEFLEIDMDKIEEKMSDSLSYLYYPVLLEKFINFDNTLSQEDYLHLYYGYIFTDMYNPYGQHENEEEFYDLYFAKKYEEAILLGKEILRSDPINTKIIFKILVCYHQTDNSEMYEKYAIQYYGLLQIIYYSGDGKSAKSAFKVINISDEYEILSELGLQSTGQALIGICDRLSIDTKSQEVEKGQEKIKELYFNISLPFEYLNKQFESE